MSCFSNSEVSMLRVALRQIHKGLGVAADPRDQDYLVVIQDAVVQGTVDANGACITAFKCVPERRAMQIRLIVRKWYRNVLRLRKEAARQDLIG